MPTNKNKQPNTPETQELPQDVTVNGWRGRVWRRGISAEILAPKVMSRIMGDTRFSALDRKLSQTSTHIAARMSDGDILMALALNPHEPDPGKRQYALTSVAMIQGRSGENNAINLPADQLDNIRFTPGKHVIIGNLQSNGLVEEVVSFASTRPALQTADGSWRYPESSIYQDFFRGIGRELPEK